MAEQRLSQAVQAIKDNPQSPSLQNFLRVLLRHYVLAEEVCAEQTAQKLTGYREQEIALAAILEQLASGKRPKVPPILEGMFDIPILRKAMTVYRAEVKATNDLNTKQNPSYLRVPLNWRARAQALMMQRTSGEQLYNLPVTPWERAVETLIGKCQVSDIDKEFVREWVVREAGFSQSDHRTAELARLDSEGVQKELLAEFRRGFPEKAEEWFGRPMTAPAEAPAQEPTPTPDQLTKVERAMQIYLRDPNQSVREVARQVGCDPSLLFHDKRFTRLRAAHQGTVPKGSKTSEGDVEAEGKRYEDDDDE